MRYDEENRPNNVNYEKAILYLVEIAKAQRSRLARQQMRLTEQSEAIRRLQEQVAGRQKHEAELEQRLNALEAAVLRGAAR